MFNNLFLNIASYLKIPTNHCYNMNFQKTDDPLLNTINKYKYFIVVMIKSKIEL